MSRKVLKTGLTARETAFVEEYLVDLNALAASKRAGYSEKSASQISVKLLTKVHIKAAIQERMDARQERTGITADYVLSKIKETIERCSQAEPVLVYSAEEKQMVPNGEWKFEHTGVLKGCELLGKHLKLFTEKIEVTGDLSIAEKLRKARERSKAG